MRITDMMKYFRWQSIIKGANILVQE